MNAGWILVLSLGAQGELSDDLAFAVDLPTPAARQRAAVELAARADVSVEAWLAAMRTFGDFDDVAPGTHDEVAALWVGADEPLEVELSLYVPPSYDAATPAPLLLALHGSGGEGRGQHRRWQSTADALGMIVLAPTERERNGGYAFTARERQSALSALRWTRRRFNVDESRIHVTGISRGGHLAWDLALRHPDRFASLSPMIGGPRIELGERNNLRYLENVAHLPVRDLQGSGDAPQLVANLRLAFDRLADWEADARLIEFPDLGHSFDMSAVDWTAFLGPLARSPAPVRVVRTVARAGEGRSYWVEVLATDDSVQETFEPRVTSRKWNGMDDAERREYLQERIDERTGRLVVELEEPGRVKAKGRGVESFRLLLTNDMLPARGPVRVRFGTRTVRKDAPPDKAVLLAEFVERFDRTFLPVAEVRVP